MKYFAGSTLEKLFLLLLVTILYFSIIKQGISDPTQKQGQKTLTTIEKSAIRETVDNKGFVSIITVTNVDRIHPGTRGETLFITANVDQQVHGELKTPVEIARYWNSQQATLQPGAKYVVALQDVTRFRPRLWLAGYQELDCEDCGKVIEMYRNIIKQR